MKDDSADTIRRLKKLIKHIRLEDIAAPRVYHRMIPAKKLARERVQRIAEGARVKF